MPRFSRLRSSFFAMATVIASLAVALSGAEFVLAWQTKRIHSAEKMDTGLMVYDSQLGWRMAPEWRGRPQHYDFDVRYATTGLGLRGAWPKRMKGKRRYALLGDSFTFGLGVNDTETFVARLNQEIPTAAFLNIGLTGYSTDQEYLYLKDRLALWQADEVWLIVYLANDLFDNTLEYPLQAEMAKPYFALEEGNLALRNVPVPTGPAAPGSRQTLASLVLGAEASKSMRENKLLHYELIRRLGLFSASSENIERDFPQRFASALSLFFKLVEAIQQECAHQGIPLKVVLMPGQSFINQPGSYSAAFQDYFRRAILAEEKNRQVQVIDLASQLRAWHETRHESLFHPNEGHLNALGNQVVAELLRQTAFKQ